MEFLAKAWEAIKKADQIAGDKLVEFETNCFGLPIDDYLEHAGEVTADKLDNGVAKIKETLKEVTNDLRNKNIPYCRRDTHN